MKYACLSMEPFGVVGVAGGGDSIYSSTRVYSVKVWKVNYVYLVLFWSAACN